MNLYQYPNSAKVGKNIPKNKLYQQGNASANIKQLFVNEVEQIIWAYKLSKDSTHLQEQKDLKEIQIFRIITRTADININIIKYIDKIFLTPIIFEIVFNGRTKVIASYKRLNQTDKSKVVLNKYYQSNWIDDTNRQPLPIMLNLADLYTHLIGQLLPIEILPTLSNEYQNNHHQNLIDKKIDLENIYYQDTFSHQVIGNKHNSIEHLSSHLSIEEKLQYIQEVESLQKQIDNLQKKIKREKQFNRQVELNMRLHKLQNQLYQLTSK